MNMDCFKKDIDELIAQFTQVLFKLITHAFLIVFIFCMNIMTLFLVYLDCLHCTLVTKLLLLGSIRIIKTID